MKVKMLLRWNADGVQIFLVQVKSLGMDDINACIQAEIVFSITPRLEKCKSFLLTQDRGRVHDITAQVTIVEDALADHHLYDTFLHQALGLRLGIKGNDLDLAALAGLFDSLTCGRSVIGIEGDEACQVRIFLNRGLGIAQATSGLASAESSFTNF